MAEAAASGLALEGEVKETVMEEETDSSEMHKVGLDEDDEDFNF